MDVGLEIKLLFRSLDSGVADAGSIDLLELEALAIVVIEGGVGEGVEAGAEVLIALRVGVEDVGEDLAAGGQAGLRVGGRDDGGGKLPVALADVDGGAVARGQPGHGGDGADEVNPYIEGGCGGGGADKGGAAGDGARPAGEEAGFVSHLLIEGGAIDEVIDFVGRNDGGRLVRAGGEGKFLVRDHDGAFGHVRFVVDNAFTEEGKLGAGLEFLDFVDGDGDGPGHVALEDDVAAGHAVELAGELVTIGKDQDVRWGSWSGWSGRWGLRVGKRHKDEKG